MYVESTVTLCHCTEVWLVCVFKRHFTVAAGVSVEGEFEFCEHTPRFTSFEMRGSVSFVSVLWVCAVWRLLGPSWAAADRSPASQPPARPRPFRPRAQQAGRQAGPPPVRQGPARHKKETGMAKSVM